MVRNPKCHPLGFYKIPTQSGILLNDPRHRSTRLYQALNKLAGCLEPKFAWRLVRWLLHALAQFVEHAIRRLDPDQAEAGKLQIENHVDRGGQQQCEAHQLRDLPPAMAYPASNELIKARAPSMMKMIAGE